MTDCFESLPADVQSRLLPRPGHKEWKHCSYCSLYNGGAVKLRICSGCVERKGEPVYYCSKECQKAHWPVHKDVCLQGEAESVPDEGAMKLLSRWLAVNYKIMRWCLEQLYHFNPAADPRKTFVCFHLDGKTMNIHRMCLQERKGHALFRDKDACHVESDLQFYLVELEASPTHEGCYKMSRYHSDALTNPEVKKRIVGYEQWPFIAHQVTSTLQQSAMIVERRLMLLCAMIKIHTGTGSLVFSKRLIATPVEEFLDVTGSQMILWRAKLNTVDLWAPLRQSRTLVSSLFKECCPLTHLDH